MTDSRTLLYNQLSELLGDRHADTLMSHLPEVPAQDAATKADIAAVRSDIAGVRTDLSADIGALRTDVDDLKTNVAVLRADVDAGARELESLRTMMHDFHAETTRRLERLEDRMERFETRFDGLRADLHAHTRNFVIAGLGSSAVVAAGMLGAAAML